MNHFSTETSRLDVVTDSATVNPAVVVPSSFRILINTAFQKLCRLHGDQQGTISILSVVVILLLTMLMGMILNVGEQIDDKIRMQNAADAATYSGGVVVARGMNTVAFTNHLLSEVFALTAYFREGRDRYAESMIPPILDSWEVVGQQLTQSRFQLFRDMQPAISPKIQMEREMVKAFGEMTAVKAKFLLPPLETILGLQEEPSPSGNGNYATEANAQSPSQSHLIPQFQRAVVQATAIAANLVTQEVMKRHLPTRTAQTGTPVCILYTSDSVPWQDLDPSDPYERIVPAIDPSFEGPDYLRLRAWEAGIYQAAATKTRRDLAHYYLAEWNRDGAFDLGPFERESLGEGGRVSAKMSYFIHLWRGFTCGKLNQLLDIEFPTTNLPHMLRMPMQGEQQQQYLEREFRFSAIIYRRQRQQSMPGMYRVPNTGDATAFARVSVFVPRPRYQWGPPCPVWACAGYDWFGVLRCNFHCFDTNRSGWSTDWSLFNQNWAAKIVPTSPENSLTMLAINPQQIAPGVNPPQVGSMTIQDFKAVNTH
jgi:hypothetical protein